MQLLCICLGLHQPLIKSCNCSYQLFINVQLSIPTLKLCLTTYANYSLMCNYLNQTLVNIQMFMPTDYTNS